MNNKDFCTARRETLEHWGRPATPLWATVASFSRVSARCTSAHNVMITNMCGYDSDGDPDSDCWLQNEGPHWSELDECDALASEDSDSDGEVDVERQDNAWMRDSDDCSADGSE